MPVRSPAFTFLAVFLGAPSLALAGAAVQVTAPVEGLRVFIDDAEVGTAPGTFEVEAGYQHSIVTRGDCLGSRPVAWDAEEGATLVLEPVLEPLVRSLAVASTEPVDVELDSQPLGRAPGSWWIPLCSSRLELSADGFHPAVHLVSPASSEATVEARLVPETEPAGVSVFVTGGRTDGEPKITYPSEAIGAEVDGTVRVHLLVDVDGSIVKNKDERCSGWAAATKKQRRLFWHPAKCVWAEGRKELAKATIWAWSEPTWQPYEDPDLGPAAYWAEVKTTYDLTQR